MQTIPDAVLDNLVEHRPHLAQMVANLRAHPELAAQIEKALANAYLLGEIHISPRDTWHLSQVAHGGAWGATWAGTVEAASLTGYSEAHLRRLCAAGDLPATLRGKTWYIRRNALKRR